MEQEALFEAPLSPGHAAAREERDISKLAGELRPYLEEIGVFDVRVAPKLARYLFANYGTRPTDG